MIRLVYVHIFCMLLSFVSGSEELSSSNLIPCIEGAYLFGEKCYKVFGQTDRKTWTEASQSCRRLGGHLATIQSKELQDMLAVFMVLAEKSHLWIGLNDRNTESEYTWGDGSIVNYTYWKPGEPAKSHEEIEDCVEMNFVMGERIGVWNDFPCDRKLPFICQLNKTTEANSPDPRFCTGEKGVGWRFSNSCYHVMERSSSWDEAEMFCQQNFGGHLVTILNSGIEMFLDYILSKTAKDFWIGIKIRDHDMQKWSSGWHLVFNKWSNEQEPAKGTCGLRKSNQWISADCTEKHPFVCETSSRTPPVPEQGKEEWRCPDSSREWKDLDGESCYILKNTKSLNWYEANYDCMTKGGRLSTIPSEDVQKAIHHHILDTQERLFIGLHRKLTDKSTFEWSDGTEVVYQHWEYPEPNNIEEECGELWTHTMTWNDISCREKKGYICSAKKLPPILFEENQTASDTLKQDKCHYQNDDATFQTATIALACIIMFSLLVGIVICLIKTRRITNIPFSYLRDVIQDRCRFYTMKRSSEELQSKDDIVQL